MCLAAFLLFFLVRTSCHSIMSFSLSSCHLRSYPVLSCSVVHCFALFLTLSCPVCHLFSFCPVLSYPVVSCTALPCPIPSYAFLLCLFRCSALPCPCLFCSPILHCFSHLPSPCDDNLIFKTFACLDELAVLPKFFREESPVLLESTDSEGRKRFTCSVCGKVYIYLKGLQNHVQKASCKLRSRRIVCPECGRRFMYHQTLRKHIDMLHPNSNLVCEYVQCRQSQSEVLSCARRYEDVRMGVGGWGGGNGGGVRFIPFSLT